MGWIHKKKILCLETWSMLRVWVDNIQEEKQYNMKKSLKNKNKNFKV